MEHCLRPSLAPALARGSGRYLEAVWRHDLNEWPQLELARLIGPGRIVYFRKLRRHNRRPGRHGAEQYRRNPDPMKSLNPPSRHDRQPAPRREPECGRGCERGRGRERADELDRYAGDVQHVGGFVLAHCTNCYIGLISAALPVRQFRPRHRALALVETPALEVQVDDRLQRIGAGERSETMAGASTIWPGSDRARRYLRRPFPKRAGRSAENWPLGRAG